MCYCKSIELYDSTNEKKEYKIQLNNSKQINSILSKREKSKAYVAKDSEYFTKFKEVVDNCSISLHPHKLKMIEFKDIISNPSEFYKNFVSTGQPCIIKNIVNDWPAYEKWQDSAYLINKAGDTEFTVDITPDGYADSIKNCYFVQPLQQKMTLKQYFKDNETSNTNKVSYIQKQNNNLNEEFSILKSDIPNNVEEFFSKLFNKNPDASNIWIGTKESVTSMHKDNYENIFVVIKGEKHFTLIPPCFYPFLQPCYYKDSRWFVDKDEFIIKEDEENNIIPWVSINPDIDEEIIDLGVEIKKYHVIIESGDGLYLPQLWYHQVSQFSHTNDVVIGVNYWFDMEYNSNFVLYDLLKSLVNLKP